MFNEFLSFDKMITTSIIKIVFYIGAIMSIIGGLITIISGITARYGGGSQVLMGILIILLGPLFTRIYCELIMVFFKIHENLTEIKKSLKKNI